MAGSGNDLAFGSFLMEDLDLLESVDWTVSAVEFDGLIESVGNAVGDEFDVLVEFDGLVGSDELDARDEFGFVAELVVLAAFVAFVVDELFVVFVVALAIVLVFGLAELVELAGSFDAADAA